MKSKATSTTIPIEKLGAPGIPGELIIVSVMPEDNRSDEEKLHDKSERTFAIQARLSKHPEANEAINADVDHKRGGSYFLAHEEAVVSRFRSPVGPFDIHHNENRELSVVTFTCNAKTAREARQKFIDGVMPIFDYLCFIADVPLFMPLIVCEDVKNYVHTFNYVTPFPRATVNPHRGELIEELLPLYALYREAKNARSPYYQFLCYFKILEGVYRHIRGAVFKRARRRSIEIEAKKELVPDHPELDWKLVGKSINKLFTGRFEKDFRHRIAHYILDSGEILNVSDYVTSNEFAKELLLLQVCARIVLETQSEYCRAANGKAV